MDISLPWGMVSGPKEVACSRSLQRSEIQRPVPPQALFFLTFLSAILQSAALENASSLELPRQVDPVSGLIATALSRQWRFPDNQLPAQPRAWCSKTCLVAPRQSTRPLALSSLPVLAESALTRRTTPASGPRAAAS